MSMLSWFLAGWAGFASLLLGFVSWRLRQKEGLYRALKADVDQSNQAWLLQVHQLQTDLILAHSQLEHWQNQAQALTEKLEHNQHRLGEFEVAHARLQAQLEEKQRGFDQQQSQLEKRFSELAQGVFNQNNQVFKQQTEQSLNQLLMPFQHDVRVFKQQLEQVQQAESEQRLALKFELQNLQKMNLNLSDQAHQLTQALQGQKKAQGNWGEMILERVLESAGLVAPRDFQREVSMQGEQGRQRPDVVVYLPGNRHVIIDAKTSLSAYSRMVNADTEALREQALKDHINALYARMKELSDKNYFKLPGLQAPEVVILFMPIESAYVEAIKADPSLLEEAMRFNLLIATPSTLLSSLQIVRQLWRFAEQNNHSAELAKRAEMFYVKLNSFINSLQTVGQQLDKAKEAYDKAFSQLYSGRGNLIKQAAEFKDLGVRVQKELPAEWVERADLELPDPMVKTREAEQ